MSSSNSSNSSYSYGENYASCYTNSSENEDDFDESWTSPAKTSLLTRCPSTSSGSYSSNNEDNENNDNYMNDNNTDYSSELSEIEFNDDENEESIEILEENNNDPNNNMNDENGEISDSIVTIVDAREGPTSPQPSCSKHSDIIESNLNITDDINDIARQILESISEITHESIVTAINKSKIHGNRKQINLSDLLPSSQYELKRSVTSSMNMKKVQLEELTSPQHPPSSPIQAGSFINRVYINTSRINDNSHDSKQPRIVLNQFNQSSEHLQLSPILQTGVIDVELDVSTEKPSTSNGIYDNHYSKPVVLLPDPQSHQRKVHIRQYCYNDDNDDDECTEKYDEASRTTSIHRSQLYEHSHPAKEILVDEQCKTNRRKERKIPTKPVHNNNYQYPTAYMNTIKSKHVDKLETLQSEARKKFGDSSKSLFAKLQLQNNSRQINAKVDIRSQYVLPKPLDYRDSAQVVQNGRQVVLSRAPNCTVKLKHKADEVNVRVENCRKFYVLPPELMDYRDPAQPGPSQSETTANTSVCLEMYHKLRAMFPNLKREYIKKFCPFNWTHGLEHDIQLSNIVDRILDDELSWDYDDNVIEEIFNDIDIVHTGMKNDAPNIDETCEYLAGIFPNADPHYLRDTAIKFKDENTVKTFVDQQLKKPDYPTREQHLAKLKITEEQERYTTNFVVADFIKLFPDPFGYFEDPKRQCQFNIVDLEFLKAIHNRIRVHIISAMYAGCNYNMSLATKQLKLCNDYMKTRRGSRPIPTANIPRLQEMAFIRHQDEIRKYVDEIQSKERIEFEALKAQGKLLVCQCCYDDECMPSKCSTCQNGHNFCNSCVITGTNSKLGDGETHISCFYACGSEFSLSTLQKILLPTKFSILLKKRQAAEVMAAGLEGLISCPFCHFASIPAEGDKVFKCLNPECMKESCIQCKEPNHVPLRCNEVMQIDKARKYIEEKMTQALARNCYKCKRAFFKEEGCNKITCPCGAIMCYLCDKPIKDYSHFAGQGSDDKSKCPLWTDNQRLNAETVREVAENARSELLRQDPTLVINTDGLAPELPPRTNGPHNHIVGAQNIAVQLAARVMKENRQ